MSIPLIYESKNSSNVAHTLALATWLLLADERNRGLGLRFEACQILINSSAVAQGLPPYISVANRQHGLVEAKAIVGGNL